MVSVVIGVFGVSGAREVGEKYAHVHVPSASYLLAIIPPVLIGILAVALPRHVLAGGRGWRATSLAIISLVFVLTEPLLYIIYDFEGRLQPQMQSRSQK